MKFRFLIIHISIPIVSLFLSQAISFSSQTNFQLKPEMTIMIPINFLLWFCLYGFCLSLFSQTYQSIFLYLFIFISFTLINYLKIKLLYQAFTFDDFSQTKTLLTFLPNFINQPKIIFILILALILFIFSFIFLKKHCHYHNHIFTRLILFPISVFILLIPITFTQQYSSIISKSDLILYRTNPTENCKKNGILFCFYDDLKNLKSNTPKGYSQSTIQKIYSDIQTPNNIPKKLNKPNIIIILSEAFFDATKLTNVTFPQDPIKNIRSDFQASLISPQLSGGTANVEFEVITGLSNYFLNNKIPYSQLVRQDIPTIFSLFKEQGYTTTVIHPYLRSMYNRTMVYDHFDLDKFITIEDMTNYQKSGPYVSDQSFMEQILKQYDSTNQPQLIFGLTMQNHYPFEPDRFTQHPITFTDNLEDIDHRILQSYIDGIHLSDLSYKFLKEKILISNKPTIVFYFGDHLPLLLSDYNIYQLLKYVVNEQENWTTEDNAKMYTTPIAAFSNFPTDLSINPKISPNFISLKILNSAGIVPKYQFKFLQSLSATDTVLNEYFTPTFSSDQINNYSLIQYDLLTSRQYLLKNETK